MHPETLAVHSGHTIDSATGAVAPPIYLSTTFERNADGSFPRKYEYIRDDNPNRHQLEDCLAALEGGMGAAAFASGLASITNLLQTLRPGDHVIAPLDAYFGTAHILKDMYEPWGLQVSFVDMTDLNQVEAAVRPNTKLIWTETPSNPLVAITDLEAVAQIAHQAGARAGCDNTWATPFGQRPFDFGFDIVMHSTTKYLGGHGDVMGGAIVVRDDSALLNKLHQLQNVGGAIPSPFDCWLILRGISTLPYRIRAHTYNAEKLAAFLNQHSAIEVVHYPGLQSHTNHTIAARQMKLFGGMLSIQVKGNRETAFRVAARLRLFIRATSLGGPISLIEHRESIEGPDTRAPENLLRISVGLEHPDDLIADLEHALEGV
jgi:cystathionine gamma-synthase